LGGELMRNMASAARRGSHSIERVGTRKSRGLCALARGGRGLMRAFRLGAEG